MLFALHTVCKEFTIRKLISPHHDKHLESQKKLNLKKLIDFLCSI